MSYADIALVLDDVTQESRTLTQSEIDLLDEALKRPFLASMFTEYPLSENSQQFLRNAIEQAQHAHAQNEPAHRTHFSTNVHDVAYGGARGKTLQYLRTYFSVHTNLMEKLSTFVADCLNDLEVLEQLQIAEASRYQERLKEFKSHTINYCAPLVPLPQILADLDKYIAHLQSQYANSTTYAWNTLGAILNRLEQLKNLEEKKASRLRLIRALDDARAAYDLIEKKYVSGTDYTCLEGLEKRLLDHHQEVVPNMRDVINQTVVDLISPFIEITGVDCDGVVRRKWTPLLYQCYLHAAGHHLQSVEKIVWSLQSHINLEDLKKEYLKSISDRNTLKTEPVVFSAVIQSLKNYQIEVDSQWNNHSVIVFLKKMRMLKKHTYNENRFVAATMTRTDEEILSHMIENGPFIDRVHLDMVLACIHPKYALKIMKDAFENGLELETIQDVPLKEKMVLTYDAYVHNQFIETGHCHFDFMHPALNDILLNQEVEDMPCGEAVLCSWLKENYEKLSERRKEDLVLWCMHERYSNAIRILIGNPFSLSLWSVTPKIAEKGSIVHYAAAHGYDMFLKIMIEANVNVDFPDILKQTSLMLAAKSGKYSTVKLLIDAGANVNHIDDAYHRSALIYAAEHKHTDIVELLISAGADIDLSDKMGYTSLILAASNAVWNEEYIDVVNVLINAGAYLECSDKKNKSLVRLTVEHGSDLVLELLGHAGVFIRQEDARQFSIIQQLFESTRIQRDKHQSLIYSARSGDLVRVRNFIEKERLNINRPSHKGQLALQLAIEFDKVEMVKEIMQYPMTPCRLIQCIQFAVEHQKNNSIPFLLNDREIARKMLVLCKNSLIWAVKNNSLHAVKFFTEAGADINQIDIEYNTALMHACFRKYDDIIAYLIEAGARTDIMNHEGVNPVKLYLLTNKKAIVPQKYSKPLTYSYAAACQRNQGESKLQHKPWK